MPFGSVISTCSGLATWDFIKEHVLINLKKWKSSPCIHFLWDVDTFQSVHLLCKYVHNNCRYTSDWIHSRLKTETLKLRNKPQALGIITSRITGTSGMLRSASSQHNRDLVSQQWTRENLQTVFTYGQILILINHLFQFRKTKIPVID